MCGFAVVIGNQESDTDLRDMLKSLRHRGPDGEGVIHEGESWLGHRRLAIVDLAGGKQPITNESGELHLVCNGEIYNHRSLRRKLRDHRFATESDNEVILHLAEEGDLDFPKVLNGMYAFVLVKGDWVYAARDPLGIKPLYIGEHKGVLYIASEIKAFPDRVTEFQEVPAGHYFTGETGIQPFLSLRPRLERAEPLNDDPETIASGVRELLTQAVRDRLMADVPVGCMLSGGVDSSLVAAIAARHYPGRLQTFCASFEGKGEDRVAARQVADFIGSEHHDFQFSKDEALKILPKVIYHLETFEPTLVKSSTAQFLVSQVVADHVKTALVGEGADELFGGYDYFKGIARAQGLGAVRKALVDETCVLQRAILRRVDRMSMAHGLELRPPFLDLRLVEYAHRIPIKYRLTAADGWEKWILRKAFDGYLPEQVLWRRKSEFAKGAGAHHPLQEAIAELVTDRDFERARREVHPPIRSKEELYYYRIFREHFGADAAVETVFRYGLDDSHHIHNTQVVSA